MSGKLLTPDAITVLIDGSALGDLSALMFSLEGTSQKGLIGATYGSMGSLAERQSRKSAFVLTMPSLSQVSLNPPFTCRSIVSNGPQSFQITPTDTDLAFTGTRVLCTLSTLQKEILASINGRADLPSALIAKSLAVSEANVRASLEELHVGGVLQVSGVLDELRMGLLKYELLIQISTKEIETISRLEDELVAGPIVWFATRVSGQFSYYLSLCLRSFSQLAEWFDNLSEEIKEVVTVWRLSRYRGWYYFGSRYLSPRASSLAAPLITGFSGGLKLIDQLDSQLLSLTSKHPFSTLRELSDQLVAPAELIAGRRALLSKLGILGAPIYRLNLTTEISRFKLLIRSTFPSAELESKLLRFLAAEPHVTEVLCLNGDWDYTVRVEVFDADCIQEFNEKLRLSFHNLVQDIIILPELGDIRWHGAIPCESKGKPDAVQASLLIADVLRRRKDPANEQGEP